MTINQKGQKVIQKLLALTQDGEMRWNRTDTHDLVLGSDNVVKDAFRGNAEGNFFRVYEARNRSYSGEFDSYYWSESIEVEMIDSNGNLLWKLPYLPINRDLFRAVMFNAGNVSKAIDKFLEDS